MTFDAFNDFIVAFFSFGIISILALLGIILFIKSEREDELEEQKLKQLKLKQENP